MHTSLVVTVIGPDRPGLVSLVSDRGKALGASWAESRMASLAGQFAGIVRFDVAAEYAEPLAASLLELESLGLRVVIARGKDAAEPPASHLVKLELVGHDRPGIVRDISRVLADSKVSIEELQTEIASGAMSGEQMFQAKALLRVPAALATDELRRVLEAIANDLMVDIALDDQATRLSALR
jgi:glycine cleavage system regulatory protein